MKSASHVVAAVEYACDAMPSLILPAVALPGGPSSGGTGGRADSSEAGVVWVAARKRRAAGLSGSVWQGGFKAVGNKKWLVEEGVTHVVNTAAVR